MSQQPLCSSEKQREKGLERGRGGILGRWELAEWERIKGGTELSRRQPSHVALKRVYKAGPLVVTDCDFEEGETAKLR